MIPVAIGALLGLFSLFRGCILLHRGVGSHAGKGSALTATVTTNSTFSTREQGSIPSSTREIIRLSPDSQPDMTSQQGKIAAALLRAGISSLEPWTSDRGTVDIADQQPVRLTDPSNLVQSLELNASKFLAKNETKATPRALDHNTLGQPFRWKPASMIWGGPILTLACLYLLALHFGWL
jgi:hypothetical protein